MSLCMRVQQVSHSKAWGLRMDERKKARKTFCFIKMTFCGVQNTFLFLWLRDAPPFPSFPLYFSFVVMLSDTFPIPAVIISFLFLSPSLPLSLYSQSLCLSLFLPRSLSLWPAGHSRLWAAVCLSTWTQTAAPLSSWLPVNICTFFFWNSLATFWRRQECPRGSRSWWISIQCSMTRRLCLWGFHVIFSIMSNLIHKIGLRHKMLSIS